MRFLQRILGPREVGSIPPSPAPPVSPQGWADETPDWPQTRSRNFANLFPRPIDAVASIEDLGRALHQRRKDGVAGRRALEVFGEEARSDLQSYCVAAQALCMGQDQVAQRKATFGKLALALATHLTHIPEATSFKLIGSYLRNLAEDMRDCGDGDLSGLGADLLRDLTMVRAARTQSNLQPRPDLPEGSTASVAEQFAERYSRTAQSTPPASPGPASAESSETHPEELAPPGNLTAELMFQVLLEECIRDGVFSREETEVIVGVRQLLGISLARHSYLHSSVQRAFEAGQIGAGGEMAPPEFFEKCCRRAMADHELSQDERKLLNQLGQHLRITAEEFVAIKQRLV